MSFKAKIKKTFFKSIADRIAWAVILVICLISLPLGLLSYFFAIDQAKEAQGRELQIASFHFAYEINQQLKDKSRQLVEIVEANETKLYLKNFREHSLVRHFNIYQKEFPVVAFVDEEGRENVKVVKGKNLLDLDDVRQNESYKLARKNPNKTIISALQFIAELDQTGLRFARVKYDYFDNFSGAILAAIPLEAIVSNLKFFGVDKAIIFCLLDQQGNALAVRTSGPKPALHIAPDKVIPPNLKPLGREKQYSAASQLVDAKVMGIQGLGVLAPVDDINWRVLAMMPQEEFLAGAERIRNLAILLGLFSLLLGVLISLILSHTLSKPIKDLTHITQALASGDYSQRAEVAGEDEVGTLAAGFNVMADELLKSRNELIVSAQNINNILRSLNECLLVVDHNLMITMANQAACDLLGYRQDELVGAAFETIFAEKEYYLEVMERARLFSQTIMQVETVYRTKSGAALPVLFSSSLMKYVGDDAPSAVCVAQNISRIKEAEKILRRSKEDLEQLVNIRTLELETAKEKAETANRTKTEFLANVSHELRTPLTHIMGFTELLAERLAGDLNEKQETYIGYITKSSRQLYELISDLLDLSRIEVGRLELNLSEVDLPLLVQDSLARWQSALKEKDIALDLQIDQSVETIQADETKLNQILNNLLSNSIKFTPAGGRIRVSVANDQGMDFGEQNKHNSGLGKWVEICVSDNGIGLNQADIERIFNPFVQADGSTTRRYEGAGLGLALVKRLVDLHGGMVRAASPGQGRGSTFIISFPLKQTARI